MKRALRLVRCAPVGRKHVILVAGLAYALTAFAVLRAQESDSSSVRGEKAKIQSEEEGDATATPGVSPKKKKKSPTPSPSPKKKKKGATAKKKKADGDEEPTATPKGKKKKSKPEKSPSPSPKKKKTAEKKSEDEEPAKTPEPPAAKAVAAASAAPTPLSAAPSAATLVPPQPQPLDEPAELTIEKNERPQSFWSRLFGGGGAKTSSGGNYQFITRSVRAELDRAPVQQRRWQFIVVHNSGTRQGNAKAFDYYHKHVRKMQNGLAYHFVIGNGTSTGNGQIEIGDRWRRQINGGHVHSDYLNNIALGICLVGDFNRDQPTRAQLAAAEELIRYLRQRCGKTAEGRVIPVKPHREVNPPRWATDCPGDAFPYSWFRRF